MASFSDGVLESVSVDSYRVERQTTQAILLEDGAELTPTPPEPRGRRYQPDLDLLSNIIQDFNERFGNIDWTDRDRVRRFLFEDLPREVSQDEEYQNAKKYSDRQNARITFDKKLEDAFQGYVFDHIEAYRQYTDNPEFKIWLTDTLFEMDYDRGVIPFGVDTRELVFWSNKVKRDRFNSKQEVDFQPTSTIAIRNSRGLMV